MWVVQAAHRITKQEEAQSGSSGSGSDQQQKPAASKQKASDRKAKCLAKAQAAYREAKELYISNVLADGRALYEVRTCSSSVASCTNTS